MAYNRKEIKVKSNSLRLRYGLSSPEVILQRSNGEVLNQRQSTIDRISQKWAVCSVKEFLVL